METILTDTVRFRFARLLAQRDAYKSQRDDLASAIGAHRYHHPNDAHEADVELWHAHRYVMGDEPADAA